MRIVRYLLALVVLLAAPALPGAAGAHVEMTPSKAPAGKPVDLSFEIPHGCDGAPTTSILVQVPKAAADATATAIAGWKAKTTPTTLSWSGGPLPDHETKAFPFRATVYGKKGDTVMFKTIQRCQGGASTAWIQSETDGEEPEHPAPAVTLASSAAEPAAEVQVSDDQVADQGADETGDPTATSASEDESDGGGSKTLILVIIAGLAVGTVAGIVIRGRRGR